MEIDPTTQKDAGYYECQADNQYAIDRRGFRTDYVVYTYWRSTSFVVRLQREMRTQLEASGKTIWWHEIIL